MESQQYYCIKNYLTNNKILESFDNKQQKQFIALTKFFELKNNQLYKKNHHRKTRNQLLRVVRKHEVEHILYLLYNHSIGVHLEVNKVFGKFRDQYYWSQIFENMK